MIGERGGNIIGLGWWWRWVGDSRASLSESFSIRELGFGGGEEVGIRKFVKRREEGLVEDLVIGDGVEMGCDYVGDIREVWRWNFVNRLVYPQRNERILV